MQHKSNLPIWKKSVKFLLVASINGARFNCPIFLELDHLLQIRPQNLPQLHLQLRRYHCFYLRLFHLTFKLLLDLRNHWLIKFNCALHRQMMHLQIFVTTCALSLASGSLKRLILVELKIDQTLACALYSIALIIA